MLHDDGLARLPNFPTHRPHPPQRAKALNIMGRPGSVPPASPGVGTRDGADAFCLGVFQDNTTLGAFEPEPKAAAGEPTSPTTSERPETDHHDQEGRPKGALSRRGPRPAVERWPMPSGACPCIALCWAPSLAPPCSPPLSPTAPASPHGEGVREPAMTAHQLQGMTPRSHSVLPFFAPNASPVLSLFGLLGSPLVSPRHTKPDHDAADLTI